MISNDYFKCLFLLACLVLQESVNPYKLDFLTSYSNDPRIWGEGSLEVYLIFMDWGFLRLERPPPSQDARVAKRGKYRFVQVGIPSKRGPFFFSKKKTRLYGKVRLHLTTNICTHRIPCMVYLSTCSKNQQNVGK